MFYGAKCKQVIINGDTMNYIVFGNGEKTLILLPGLGDGVAPVHGWSQAISFAMTYRIFAEQFTVYLFSRKDHLKEQYSTRDMAKDQAKAMKILGISKACVMGVSQGGMIAQWLAIDHPELVERLVLGVTLSKQNKTVQDTINTWTELAKNQDYKGLMIAVMEKTYSEKYLKKYRLLYPVIGYIGKPKDFSRFLIQAHSCIQHNTYSELEQITCPTLILGGDCDQVVGKNSSCELAKKIKDNEVYIYKGLGHGAYEEAKDFNDRILEFITR